MRLKTEDFSGFSILFTEIIMMCSLFLMFTYLRGGDVVEMHFFPWFAAVLVLYGVNLWIQRRETAANFILLFNTAAVAILCILGCLFFTDADSVLSYFFSIVFFAISGIRAAYIVKNGVHPNQMLIYTELTIFFLAFFLLEQNMLPRLEVYNKITFAALCCDLISLILIRLISENRTRVSGSKYQGIFVIGAILLLTGTLVIGMMMILSDRVRVIFSATIGGFLDLLQLFAQGFMAFFALLFSLLPQHEGRSPFEMEAGEASQMGGNDMVTTDVSGLIGILLIAGLLFAVVVFLITIFKMRGKRTQSTKRIAATRQGAIIQNGMWKKIKAFFTGLKKRCIFQYEYLCNRNTPQGLFLQLEQFARRKKVPRQDGESPAFFVRRMGRWMKQEDLVDSEAPFLLLADQLEQIFYSHRGKGELPAEITAILKKSISG